MTQDEIIEMAEKAGFLTNKLKSYVISPYNFEDQDLYEELEAFAKLVAAKERDAMYDIVMVAPFKEMSQDEFDGEIGTALKAMAFSITAAIRARGEA